METVQVLMVVMVLGMAACAPGRAHNDIQPIPHGPRALTDDQQIRQVLNRLTFGPRPGDYERVRAMGVDRWVGEQLAPAYIDDTLTNTFLMHWASLALDEPMLANIYAQPGDLRKQGGTMPDTVAIRAADKASGQVLADIRSAKVARATLSNQQLQEVMVDFWENHFSVYADKGPVRYMLIDYDRRIRAHALGKFRDLLGAVAHSPAMLYYLDNWDSKADSDHITLAEFRAQMKSDAALAKYEATHVKTRVDRYGNTVTTVNSAQPPTPYRRPTRHGVGLNENYGRELLELHTLGVDGGYTQQDVINAARILTGWTIRDPDHIGQAIFRPEIHDAGTKVVLGHLFPEGHGEDEGETLLDLVAHHPATAHFIALKLARRFVSDSPSTALVERAAQTFMQTDGDIPQVMRTLISSPEFFARAAYRTKVKSPFEVVVSTLRVLDGQPDTLQRAVQAVARLGEPLYGHIAPDGYPETGEDWMNAGAILNRINFGVQAASGQIPGVSLQSWPPGTTLMNAPKSVQVNTVIQTILGGDISPDTRRVLDEGMSAVNGGSAPSGNRNSLVQVLGLALGTPEFQRR